MNLPLHLPPHPFVFEFQIQAGKRLKKAETLDRSAPIIEGGGSKGNSVGRSGPGGGSGFRSGAPGSNGTGPAVGGPPQLGSLFAGGVPKLKSVGQTNLGEVAVCQLS